MDTLLNWRILIIKIWRIYSSESGEFENCNSSNLAKKIFIFVNVSIIINKTGLQPVSRTVEQVHYFGGWVEGAISLWCQGFADRTGGGYKCTYSLSFRGKRNLKLNDCFLGDPPE